MAAWATGIETYAMLNVTTGLEAAIAVEASAASTISASSGVLATASSANAAAASAATAASVVPIIGWCIAGAALTAGILGMTTNIFGSTYGRHNADAGFYFERKSHSKSGNWGYDTATLVNVFLSKVDAKIAEEKEAYKNKNNPNS